jgi:hypothetical protein
MKDESGDVVFCRMRISRKRKRYLYPASLSVKYLSPEGEHMVFLDSNIEKRKSTSVL